MRFVQWLEPEYESRREIVHEEAIGSQHADDAVVEDHLQALGYLWSVVTGDAVNRDS